MTILFNKSPFQIAIEKDNIEIIKILLTCKNLNINFLCEIKNLFFSNDIFYFIISILLKHKIFNEVYISFMFYKI